MKNFKKDIQSILNRVETNNTKIFSKKLVLVGLLPKKITKIIKAKSNEIYISDFIVAKIKGKIKKLKGHPEIKDEIFLKLPNALHKPLKIIKDTRSNQKFLFVGIKPLHLIVIEINREETNKNEINSIFKINQKNISRLEKKFEIILKR